MEDSVVQNMKNTVKEYKENLDESVNKLSSKIELANSFEGSYIAEAIKEYLESIVSEIQKMTTFVDGFEEALVSNSVQVVEGEDGEPVIDQDVVTVESSVEETNI